MGEALPGLQDQRAFNIKLFTKCGSWKPQCSLWTNVCNVTLLSTSERLLENTSHRTDESVPTYSTEKNTHFRLFWWLTWTHRNFFYSQECFTQNNKSKRHGLTMQRESSPLQRKSDFQPSYQRRCCQATQTSTLKIRVNWLCWQHLSTPSLHQLSPTRSDPFKTSRATRRAWWEPVKAAQHVCFCRNYISFNIFRAFKSSSCTICSLCTVT